MPRKRTTVSTGRSVLVIDDNAEYLTSTARIIARDGHEVLTASSGEDGLRILRARSVDLVLVDYFMPGMTGEQFVSELRAFDASVQVILQTGYASEQPPRELLRRLDIQGYHDKSEGPAKLALWVDVGLRAAYTVQLLDKSRRGLEYILSVTPELHRIQPLDQLLNGVLLQTVGLLGAVDSFLAVASGPPQEVTEEAFVATVQAGGKLRVRAGTGRFAASAGAGELDAAQSTAIAELMRCGEVRASGEGTVVPLRVGQSTLGVIYVDRKVAQPRDVELVRVFANQAAVAIHNASLYELAAVDQLTRVYTRTFFQHALLRELRSAHRLGRGVGLLLVDVDDMKSINDVGGHLCGDQALAAVGSLLRRCTRATDVIGRYGGDEFVVVLPGADAAGTEVVARRIVEQCAGLQVPGADGKLVDVRLTVGTAVVRPEDEAAAARSAGYFEAMARRLVDAADACLYGGKSAGKARTLEARAVGWDALSLPPSSDGHGPDWLA